ncbi:MAG: hypothetical protein ABMB14_09830, partial [Myxococcota bacterium]
MSTDPWASLARLGAAIDRSDPALRNAAIDSLLDPGVWAEIDAIADRFDRGADPHPTDEARVATVFRARMALAAGAPRPDPSADALAAIDRLGASRAGAGWVLDDDGWARCAVG